MSGYATGADTQFRLSGLESAAQYTVRVCAVRAVGGTELVGGYSPPAAVQTPPRASPAPSPAMAATTATTAPARQTSQPAWTDQQWAVIILCGFTLFALVIAMVIQQLISWGTVSS